MDPLTAEDPTHIGPYRLIARLGAGGMGRVYLARSEDGRTVAVKVIQAELAQHHEFRARFAREVEAARKVGGKWTAPVLDEDTEARSPWVATGYVPGPDLTTVVAEDFGPLPEASVRALASGLARALAEIHAAGLIHRDLKPSNVLITIDGPRVIDFGIARALETLAEGALTRTGAVIGSPGFMSPEQVRGQRLTPASDVFCLGSVLAYAATGRSPFGTTASGLHALMYRVAEEHPDLSGIPEPLLDLVQQCLHKDPTQRPTPQDVLARTATDPDEPWLPGKVLSQLGRQSAQLLDFAPSRAPEPTVLAGPAPDSAIGFGPAPAPVLPYTPTATPTHQNPPQPSWQPPAQAPPLPPAPSLHSAPSNVPSGPAAPTRFGRRRVVVAAVAATAFAVLVGGLFVIRPWDTGSPKTGGEKNKPSILPDGYAGTWTGAFVNGTGNRTPVRLKITGGGRGDKVAEYSTWLEGHVCVYSGRLTSASTGSGIKIAAGTLERSEPKAATEDCAKLQPGMTLTHSSDDTIERATGEEDPVVFKKHPLSDPGSRIMDPFGGQRSAKPGKLTHYEEFDMRVFTPGEDGITFRIKEYGNTCHYITEAFSLVDIDNTNDPKTTLYTAPAQLRTAGNDGNAPKSDPGCRKDGPLLEITHFSGVDGKWVSMDAFSTPEGDTSESEIRLDRSTG
ncbi:hypothetical protein GCM10009837_67970 [Streptomyces durmitorensis]|uniref:Protein kinase n=1 Tax=Streptomyces durmitorensis TaxID=319947 RepID=A0ABY4Q803_9ACTN|nr:serine/threonine-protein kinase [Streptomyces durmitorensis]UQT61269.1 protein kinase [Streptomyces durmitorensis]